MFFVDANSHSEHGFYLHNIFIQSIFSKLGERTISSLNKPLYNPIYFLDKIYFLFSIITYLFNITLFFDLSIFEKIY